jgi:polysaccharide export outer membrane protein
MGIAKRRMTRESGGRLRLNRWGSPGIGLAWLVLVVWIAVGGAFAQTPPPAAPQQPKPKSESKPATEATAKPDEKLNPLKDDASTKPDSTKPAGPAGKATAFSTEVPKDLNDQPEYIIGPGDSLMINVWKEPEVSANVTVRGDCRITLNLIKDVEICSMTPTQISSLLTDRLSKFIAAPDVTVTLMGLQSRKVYFIGQGVKRQGGMVLNGPLTIAQALSDAGGLSEFGNGKKVVIQRRDQDGNVQPFIFNYNDYLKGKNPKGNIMLQPGDFIICK